MAASLDRMMTFKPRPRPRRILGSVLLVGLWACSDDASDSDTTDDTGSSAMTSSGETGSGTGGPADTTADASATAATGSAGSGDTDGNGDSSDGGTAPPACEESYGCMQYALVCGVDIECGGLARFDADGCPYPVCNPGECPRGQRCYSPIDFGGCAASGPVSCFDDADEQACVCPPPPPECGGAWCVAEADYPAGA